MEYIDSMTSPPVAGRFYMVPTIRYRWNGYDGIWPVIGPKHEDAEIIGFPHQHYHVDGRFLTKRQWDQAGGNDIIRQFGLDILTVAAISALAGSPLTQRTKDRTGNEPHPPVVYRRRMCTRARIDYLHEDAPPVYDMAFFPKLRAAYKDDCLRATDAGWVCPHRGAHLGSIKPNDAGVIVCPLHGLEWDAVTGKQHFREPELPL